MARKLSDKGVARVLHAAGATHVDTDREAAILGGIVRSLIDVGQFNVRAACTHAPRALAWFENTARSIHYETDGSKVRTARIQPDMSLPTEVEVRAVTKLFVANYDPDTSEGASPP